MQTHHSFPLADNARRAAGAAEPTEAALLPERAAGSHPSAGRSLNGASLRAARPAIVQLYLLGEDVRAFLDKTGIEPPGLFAAEARIPLRNLFEVWRGAAELANDPDFGLHAAERVDFHLLGRLAFQGECHPADLFIASATLGEGLYRLARYSPLLLPTARLEIERAAGAVRVRLVMSDAPPAPRAFTEFWLGWIVRAIHHATRRSVTPREVRFAHSAPRAALEHRRILACPVRFDAGDDAFVLDAAHLDVPLGSASPILHALIPHAEQQLARLPPVKTFAERVRALIAAELATGRSSATQVAGALHISTRTLGRRLGELGTSHRALLDDVRAELARQYLEEKLPVHQVARLLGFSGSRAFYRAFQRWYERSPASYRGR